MKSERVQKRKQERERARRTKQISERVLLTICIAALVTIGSSAMLTKATTREEVQNQKIYYKYYTQIEIQSGDSLWTIAGKYMKNGPYKSRTEYINEVAELNQLSGTMIIKGQYLIVPYYDDTYK